MVESALDQESVASAKEYLGRISRAADRMDHLIADALAYSRAVRHELPLERVETGALLRDMLDTYPEFQSCRASICFEEDIPAVLANEAGLTKVFSNLIGNAVKFVPDGEHPEVRIWAERNRTEVRLVVEDKGIGVPQSMLPRLFDMFSRGSTKYPGTGIGLALVRKVVQRMGGKLGVESEVGVGSRFWVELKYAGRLEGDEAASADGMTPATPGSGIILYVEDEEYDRAFMELAFRRKKMEDRLRIVEHGRAAVDYLAGNGPYADRQHSPLPDIILLDLNLPDLSGFNVLEWIKHNPASASIPVIILSSSGRPEDHIKAKALGASGYLVKPASGLEFCVVLETLTTEWMEVAEAPPLNGRAKAASIRGER